MPELPAMTDDEVKTLASDILIGKVYTDRHIPPGEGDRAIAMVFMPLVFVDPKDLPEDVGMVYEYLEKAGPQSVNGMPGFFSMHLVNKADTARVWATYKELRSALDNVKVPS